MRELNIIEDKGLFGITFKSDDKEEANTVMRAIQRFILTREKISNNNEDCTSKKKSKAKSKAESKKAQTTIEDIQEEIDKRKKESFEEQLQKDNSIISFSEDEEEAYYKIDEDPLSSDSNINRW
ncbi:hypothetical protein, partial [Brachyspira pilosicoli]